MLPNYYHPLQKQKNPNNAAIQWMIHCSVQDLLMQNRDMDNFLAYDVKNLKRE